MISSAGIGFTIFILILFFGIYASLFSLPGTVIIFFDVLVYAVTTEFEQVGFRVIIFLFIVSLIAEAFDFWTYTAGALRPPFSKNIFFASAAGAVAGSLILTASFWGAGTFGGFFLGGLAGMLIAECFRQSNLQSPFKATRRAVLTMVGGKVVKGFAAFTMIAFSLSHIYS